MVRVRTPSIVEASPRPGPSARSMPKPRWQDDRPASKGDGILGEALPSPRLASETSMRICPSGEVATARDDLS